MYATLSVVCMLAIATGESAPAAAAPTAPQIGACRWVCGGNPTRFTSAAACDAACATECEVLC
ncbi:MAG TPA: hypothetical protein VGD37_26160 [Kofleriaceae bacterium]